MQVPHSGIDLKENKRKILIKAPTRVDLSGGTLDIWPLYCLFEKSRTINLAIDGFVEVKMSLRNSEFLIKQEGKIFHFGNLKKLQDSEFSLYGFVFALFNLKGIEVEIIKMPPKFSGLGGSSALLLCLLKGIFYLLDIRVKNRDLISLGRDIEARNMGYPTGTQDFYPPLYGGALCINYNLGNENFERLRGIRDLKKYFLLYNTGVKHHSGRQNFEVFKEAIEKKEGKVYKNLKEIAGITNLMYEAFKERNFKEVGKLMGKEWDLRKELSPAFNHPELDRAIETGKKLGVWGYKPCGAAGGGSIAFLAPPEIKKRLKNELNLLKGEVLPYNITWEGIILKVC